MAAWKDYSAAEAKANEVLREMGISGLPVDPFAIAKEKGIVVEAKPASKPGVSGMLVHRGDQFGILYATHIKSEGFQRFSVAHELGHFFLDGHIDHVLPAGVSIHESRSGFVSRDEYEQEADHFAANLLMPRALFCDAMDRFEDGLTGILGLAELCRTSLPATAIRFIECSSMPVAVIMTTGETVDFCNCSKALFALDQEIDPLPKGSTVPPRTVTRTFNKDRNKIASGARTEGNVTLQDWLGGRSRHEVLEEVIGLGSYSKTLTVLTLSGSFGDEEEKEDDEEDLEESWTPRFRR